MEGRNFIEWTDKEFSINNDILDAQHKGFVKMINDIFNNINLIDRSKEFEYFECVKEDISNYLKIHFYTEEKIMGKLNICKELVKAHIKEHDKFIENFDMIIKNFKKEDLNLDELVFFLIDWIADHVQTIDKKTFKEVN